ncbi:hypothetical protein ACGF07_34565 [Kitasatospora sp. NPDC048194]|uniref:hypothetical protein n=1 Tax=Kitasatospora sp. NPDC048194 TaxID=3364045 RepID=UPI0037169DF6
MESQPANSAEYTEPSAEELGRLRHTLWEAVWSTAERIAAVKPGEIEPPEQVWQTVTMKWRDMPGANLAALRVLREVAAEVESMASETAHRAGRRGATYPQLGTAWGVTRQAARSRWPKAVQAPAVKGERAEVQLFGGRATVSHLPDEGGWWWIGTGADEVSAEAEQTYDSQAEAAAAAGAFLAAHQIQS